MRERIKEEAPGARLMWDEAVGRLVLRVPKSEVRQRHGLSRRRAPGAAIIDRVLGVPAR